ncbi:MAG: UvrD-helicase domain-containing protein [Candidatus Dormibacteria bacterium]
MTDDLALDEDQKRAVESSAASLVIVAGAGCGKTEVVARRVQRLLESSSDDAYRVLAVSYTVRASDELRSRLYARLGDRRSRIDADTIHGFAWSLLRQYGTKVGLPIEPEVLIRDADRADLLDRWLRASGRPPLQDPVRVLQRIDIARARGRSAPLLQEWDQAMSDAGAVDYPAMLDKAGALVGDPWVNRHLHNLYGHFIVDEAQNLTAAQYALLTRVIGAPDGGHIHAALVGDTRQSIVGFAGADPSLMQRFEVAYHAERVELRTNYRSARAIAEAADRVSQSLGQPTKALGSVNFAAQGCIEIKDLPDESAEAAYVASWIAGMLASGLPADVSGPTDSLHVQPEQVAVLARAGSSLLGTARALTELGIESATSSTEEDWVASTVAKVFVELVAYRSAPSHYSTKRHLEELCGSMPGTSDELLALLASARDPEVRGLAGLVECEDISSMMAAAGDMSFGDPDWPRDWEQLSGAWMTLTDQAMVSELTFGNFRQHIARCQRGEPASPGVRLRTVHKAQGQEFKAVAVVACNDGQFPDFRATSEEAASAELRTFYVALTRPSRALLLTRAMERVTRSGGSIKTTRSRYLALVASFATAPKAGERPRW